jgi:hypothetical protein
MEPLAKRPQWEIDYRLTRLLGEGVRVAAKSFSPVQQFGGRPLRFIPVKDLYLPDNSQTAGAVVFFEGRLQRHERQIGVVRVWLDAFAYPETACEGSIYFRGRTAVILFGPAVVELAFPFHVERLPGDAFNYWTDLREPCAQFCFPFFNTENPGREEPPKS